MFEEQDGEIWNGFFRLRKVNSGPCEYINEFLVSVKFWDILE
jgi:hypothetical protein